MIIFHKRRVFKDGLTVEKNSRISGYVKGELVVKSNVTLSFRGMIDGNLSIEKGAEAKVLGQISGNIYNDGILKLRGAYTGILNDSHGQTDYIHRVIMD